MTVLPPACPRPPAYTRTRPHSHSRSICVAARRKCRCEPNARAALAVTPRLRFSSAVRWRATTRPLAEFARREVYTTMRREELLYDHENLFGVQRLRARARRAARVLRRLFLLIGEPPGKSHRRLIVQRCPPPVAGARARGGGGGAPGMLATGSPCRRAHGF